jgi:hypothetical protein
MDRGGHRGIHQSGRRVGVAPRRMLSKRCTALCAFTGYPKPSVLSVSVFLALLLAWRMESNAAHPNFWPPARSVRSQCRQPRHQTTSFRKSTTKRFPRSSVDRPEQQAICPRSPMPHRGSRRRTLLAILKRSPPSGEFKRRASCSRTCSDGWSELRNISESTSPDHWRVGAFEGQDSRDHLTLLIMAYDRWCLFNVPS